MKPFQFIGVFSLECLAPAFEMNLVQLLLKGGQRSVILDGCKEVINITDSYSDGFDILNIFAEIGRASCRERV